MSDVDITSARSPGHSRTISTKTRLLEATSVAAVDIAPERTTGLDEIEQEASAREVDQAPRVRPGEVEPAPSRSRRLLHEIVRKKRRQRFRGIPPPLTFDLDVLPDSTVLTETEAAAALRRSKSALEGWRKLPDHPLKWRYVAGRVIYELSSIRELLKGGK
jgi:hypothetical protein